MKTTLRFWAAIAVTAGLFAGCSDLEDYKNKVDELDGRVTALETITTNLNKNIEALQTLYGGATINSATKDANNVWTIVLSNGETLTLNQGSVGVANAPVMSVDEDGYWMVDYDGNGGNAPEYIKNGEDKVLASGTDGVTPEFGVDAEKYWTEYPPFTFSYRLTQGDLNYENQTASYNLYVYADYSEKFDLLMEKILIPAFQKAYKEDWKKIPKNWPEVSIHNEENTGRRAARCSS